MIQQDYLQEDSSRSVPYSAGLKVSKYSLLAQLYFFFNSVLLPKGLLFTQLLAPIFYWNVVKQKKNTFVIPFGLFLIVFDTVHLYEGVDLVSFLISNIMFVLTYFGVVGTYYFFQNYEGLGRIYKELLLVNGMMCLIAIPFFFAPRNYQVWFWYINLLTKGVEEFPRLAMLTYEASYYSLLFAPIFIYYLLKFGLNMIGNSKWWILGLIVIPMLMSLSFGVLGTLVLTVLIMMFIFFRRIFVKKRAIILISTGLFLALLLLVFLILYYPDNAFFIRLRNVVAGKDTSANGRTIDSFSMAWRIAAEKNLMFGAGLGQIKIMAAEIVRKHYQYWGVLPRYDIPNAMGETLAIFGIFGVMIKLFLEIYLFIKTRVRSNYYRLALFIFIFIYQFTGSFITNIAEYVIWALAFSQVFPQFNVGKQLLKQP